MQVRTCNGIIRKRSVPVFTLDSVSAQAVELLEEAMVGAVRKGDDNIVLAIDAVGSFDNKAIRAIITLLRRVRERGGDVSLRTSRPDIIRTLSVTGLDHVFRVDREVAVAC
jgi:anti-anti-sigma factor